MATLILEKGHAKQRVDFVIGDKVTTNEHYREIDFKFYESFSEATIIDIRRFKQEHLVKIQEPCGRVRTINSFWLKKIN